MKFDFIALCTVALVFFLETTLTFVSAFPDNLSSLETGNVRRQNPQELFERKVAHYYPTAAFRKQAEILPDAFDNNDVGIGDTSDDGGGGHSHSGIGGAIAGGVIGIVAISLLGVFLIPLLLLPLGVVILIGYNFPLVILIDLPNLDQNNNGQDQLGRASTSLRSILESGSCIERISCRIGKRSGTSFRTVMHWISTLAETKLIRRISRGFEDENDCSSYICGVPILRTLF